MAKQNARGLGRGLDALLGGGSADLAEFRRPVQYVNSNKSGTSAKPGDIQVIDINLIEPNPYQPRVTFDEQALNELSSSIRTLGLIQPITVRPIASGRYQIISGERRFRASKLAGLQSMPAYIREAGDSGMLEMAIVENVQRADLDPIETAMSYQRLIEECNLTQEQMADRIGKNRVSVTNYLRLLRLPAKVQYDLKVGNISVGHAKVLLGVDDQNRQEELCDAIIRQGLSVRALEELLRSGNPVPVRKNAKPAEVQQDLPDEYYKIVEIVGKYFSNNVSVKTTASGKGSMTVHFDNEAQMLRFLKALQDKDL